MIGISWIERIAPLIEYKNICRTHQVYSYPYTTADIRIANIDGTNARILVNERIQIHYANFLPNGQKIVFVQEGFFWGGTPPTLYSMNPDGSDRRVLRILNYFPYANSLEYEDQTRTCLLTPDSRYMLYIGYDDNTRSSRNILRVALDGSQITNLTQVNTSGHMIADMALSDDGQHIIYTEYDGQVVNDEYRLCMIDINGGQRQVLKTMRGNKILFPHFLPTDNNGVVYISRSFQDANIGALHLLSIRDTSDDKIKASVSGACKSTAISADNKLVYLDSTYYSAGYYADFKVVNLRNGTTQILKLPNQGNVLSSVDKTIFSVKFYSNFWTGRFDGSLLSSININTDVDAKPFVKGERLSGGNTVRSVFTSPDNNRIIYIISVSREVWS
ncbi:MAG TPA: hypothetical protein VK141_07810 [Nitrosomonas sp.]|nr:hypothetical protein [Nitrosomonas sp.]